MWPTPHPQTLLIFDNATVVLEIGCEGKIISKTDYIGQKRCHEMLENRGRQGRWLITERSAPTSAIA
jgi:hypothetical protein